MINDKQIIDRYDDDQRILGVLAVQNQQVDDPLLGGFDLLVLVVTNDEQASESIHHYIKEGRRIQERWVLAKSLEEWLLSGVERHVIQWLLEGEILIDRGGYMHKLRGNLQEFDVELREKKLLSEFALFMKSYLQSKDYLRQNYVLDAYSQILAAIHHWARITVIETGTHPEVIVWQQVQEINPGVYKLYDELTHSDETVEQRVQLLVLACEFAVVSKLKECSKLLLRILGSREGTWSVMDLYDHPELRTICVDLSPVLKKLVAKSLVEEIVVTGDAELAEIELQYRAV